MRKLLYYSISSLCFLSLFFVFSAHAENEPSLQKKSIIVVSDDNYPPYVFRDDKGALQGILPDQWKLWEHKMGISVSFIGMEWNKAQQFMTEGKADVIDTIFITSQRLKHLDFTPPYATIEVPVFTHKNISGIGTIAELQGYTIGVKEGDACIDIFKKHGITSLELYPNYKDIIDAAAQNKLKVFCVDGPPAMHYLYKYCLETEYKRSLLLYSGQFHRAVAKGNKDVLALVQKGFSLITPQEYTAIEKKWIGSPLSAHPFFFKYGVYISIGLFILFVCMFLIYLLLRIQRDKIIASLREQTNMAQALLSISTAAAFLIDREGICLDANETLCRRFNKKKADIIGTSIWALFPLDVAECRKAHYATVLLNKKQTRYEDERNGMWNDSILIPILDKHGEVSKTAIFGFDITDRKHTEQKLQAALQEKETLLRELYHRTKNNMQVIQAMLELESMHSQNQEIHTIFHEIKNRIMSMMLVHQNLYRSPNLSDINIKAYISELIYNLMHSYQVPHSKIQFVEDIDMIALSIDKAIPCGLILNELISNAFKYAFPHTRSGIVTIRVKKLPSQEITIEVSDNGVGIPPEKDLMKLNTLGLRTIRTIVQHQLEGTILFNTQNGFSCSIRFKGDNKD